MLGANTHRLKTWSRDETGMESVEWILLLGALIIPLAAAMLKIASLLGLFYAGNSWIISLPFP